MDAEKERAVESVGCTLRISSEGRSVGWCELHITGEGKSTGQPIMLVAPSGSFSPLEYIDQVSESIGCFLESIGSKRSIDDYDKYFDLLALRGMRSSRLVHWLPSGDFAVVSNETVDASVLSSIRHYYDRKMALFRGSLLSLADKADLIALALSQDNLDEFLSARLLQQIAIRLDQYAMQPNAPALGDRLASGGR